MNKYNLKLASLMLLCVTSPATSMRQLDPNIGVYVTNKAIGLDGKQYTITIKVEPNTMYDQTDKLAHQLFEEKIVDFSENTRTKVRGLLRFLPY